jgi:hypothetical protein
MENIEKTLLALKDKALEATKNADGDFYEHYLDDSAIAIVPFGVFDKKAIVQQMGSANSSFNSTHIDDTKAIVLTPDSGLVTYKADFERMQDGKKIPYSVFVTTIYAKIDGEWKGVFYQQTPLQK